MVLFLGERSKGHGQNADHLRRLHNLDKPLEMSLHSESKWKGEVSSGNVVLDLIGSEKPEEIVLIGGHLDSWDLGTGAVDDGAGIAITTAAAALIAKLPKRPKRTIRVVMFGAEEVGLLGAFAYAKQHEANLKNHVLATESDFGAQTIWQLVSNVNLNRPDFPRRSASSKNSLVHNPLVTGHRYFHAASSNYRIAQYS
jgi:hypothetical protein